jgi:hypothetical protein
LIYAQKYYVEWIKSCCILTSITNWNINYLFNSTNPNLWAAAATTTASTETPVPKDWYKQNN